ncbi:MAG: MOSC domain-containing protein [Anaerolineae bacterium]|nr:MOSC domain-containing protein [Anaerolineae bacterium]
MTGTHISALYIYPVKSCAGIRVECVELDRRGPKFDRQWMVVDHTNRFVTQREYSQLALVQTALSDESLVLTAPGLPPLSVPLAEHEGKLSEVVVWRDTCLAIDEGDTAGAWFSGLLKTRVRLVRMPDHFERLTSTEYTPEPGTLSFADGYPLLFISEASLDDLNRRLLARGQEPVSIDRFRPNVVLAGCLPYAEDTWQYIHIAGIRFDIVKPCARCVITTVDQSSGTIPVVGEPLATLATYRRGKNGGAMFGQNALHRSCGILRVGDVVETPG